MTTRVKRNEIHPNVGDVVGIDRDAWDAGMARVQWTDPLGDQMKVLDQYRVVDVAPNNPFVAVVSQTTGRRMGLNIGVLDLNPGKPLSKRAIELAVRDLGWTLGYDPSQMQSTLARLGLLP